MIDRKEVAHVAKLARLAVPEADLPKLADDLAKIVRYVEQIQALSLEGVPPLSHGGDASDVFRDDTPRPGLSRDDALANAPDRTEQYFRVPKVVAEE
jgi:aspartyl-tRNA(Asn)/glutamyl-tRNA(Gln) amidotransferase subunit C